MLVVVVVVKVDDDDEDDGGAGRRRDMARGVLGGRRAPAEMRRSGELAC